MAWNRFWQVFFLWCDEFRIIPPPPPPSVTFVTIFIYDFCSTSKGQIRIVFDAIRDILAQELRLRGTKAFKLNSFQESFEFLRVILTPEIAQKTLLKRIILPIVLQIQK